MIWETKEWNVISIWSNYSKRWISCYSWEITTRRPWYSYYTCSFFKSSCGRGHLHFQEQAFSKYLGENVNTIFQNHFWSERLPQINSWCRWHSSSCSSFYINFLIRIQNSLSMIWKIMVLLELKFTILPTIRDKSQN